MILLICLTVVGAVVVVLVYGKLRWRSVTKKRREQLEKGRAQLGSALYDERQIVDLPAPVQRYFKKVLVNGQRIVAAVNVSHRGSFNMGKEIENWKYFSSSQRVVTSRPGFDWDARIAMMPGIPVFVRDSYMEGEGLLLAAVVGLVPVASFSGPGEMARGELMRFFAESAWYPTALLPSQGVTWEAVDGHRAHATISDGDIRVTLLFRFSDEGLIASVSAAGRGQVIDGKIIMTPWQARLWNYEVREGMRVPIEGEVSWITKDGPKPYWRGRITRLHYDYVL
jgi:hypothetical protein